MVAGRPQDEGGHRDDPGLDVDAPCDRDHVPQDLLQDDHPQEAVSTAMVHILYSHYLSIECRG